MKNKLIIILFIMLLLPLQSPAVEDSLVPIEEPAQIEEINAELPSENLPVEEKAENKNLSAEQSSEQYALNYKQPISKKKLLKKFIKAMFCVGIFSILLYAGLLLYKRTNEYSEPQIKTPDGETPLTAPNDTEGAVKIFLDKTKW